jgi:hypothetical protein
MLRVQKALLIISFLAMLGLVSQLAVPVGQASQEIDSDLALMPQWQYFGGQEGAEMGYATAAAGDVNGDGYGDIIFGSPLYTRETPEGIYREGAAFVFYGAAAGLAEEPDWISGGALKGARFGHALAGIGDLDGDGYDDVVIGAPDYQVDLGDSGTPKSGAIFYYPGSVQGLGSEPAVMILAEGRESGFGYDLASAGDVNGDGYADLIVGAPWYSSGQDSEGKVYVYYGSPAGLNEVADWTYECNMVHAACGYAVASAGDLNGDGYDEVVFGAPTFDGVAEHSGRIYVFFGSAAGLANSEPWLINGWQEDGLLGVSVAGAGDVNGDGFADLAVGASGQDGQLPALGAAFVYLGSPNGLSHAPAWSVFGSQTASNFGASLQPAGDVNMDGFDDLIIGAYLFGENGSLTDKPNEGAAYLYLGSRVGLQIAPVWGASGQKADAWFGFAVTSVGDVNGDQAADLLIGAPKYRTDENVIMGRVSFYPGSVVGIFEYVFMPVVVVWAP